MAAGLQERDEIDLEVWMPRQRLSVAVASIAAVAGLGACGGRTLSGDAEVDAGASGMDISCGATSGVQQGAPWPMLRRCPDRGGGTPAIGPAARPSVAWTMNGVGPALVIGAGGTLYGAMYGSDGGSVVATTPDRASRGDVIWWASTGQRDGTGAPVALDRDGTLYTQPDPFNGNRTGLTALRP